MSIFSGHRPAAEVPERYKKPLAWALLVLLISASFAIGYLIGRGDTATPIVIESKANIE